MARLSNARKHIVSFDFLPALKHEACSSYFRTGGMGKVQPSATNRKAMSDEPEDVGALVSIGGLLAVGGALLVVISLFQETATVGDTVLNLYLIGGVIFAIGFAAGAQLHVQRGDSQRAAVQVVAAVGWVLVVVGGDTGPRPLFYGGLILLLGAGAVLYDVPQRLQRVFG